jgi:uncharacterized damage-inducible protein DinB
MNPIVEKSLKHMAWANEEMLNILLALPDEAMKFSSWNPDWTVGKIVHHIVDSQGRLISRITSQLPPVECPEVTTADSISDLLPLFKERDAHIFSLANEPDQMHSITQNGKKVEFLTSTVIAQSVHHAAEHRVQISDILANNKMDVLNLDSLSFFRFESSRNK